MNGTYLSSRLDSGRLYKASLIVEVISTKSLALIYYLTPIFLFNIPTIGTLYRSSSKAHR